MKKWVLGLVLIVFAVMTYAQAAEQKLDQTLNQLVQQLKKPNATKTDLMDALLAPPGALTDVKKQLDMASPVTCNRCVRDMSLLWDVPRGVPLPLKLFLPFLLNENAVFPEPAFFTKPFYVYLINFVAPTPTEPVSGKNFWDTHALGFGVLTDNYMQETHRLMKEMLIRNVQADDVLNAADKAEFVKSITNVPALTDSTETLMNNFIAVARVEKIQSATVYIIDDASRVQIWPEVKQLINLVGKINERRRAALPQAEDNKNSSFDKLDKALKQDFLHGSVVIIRQAGTLQVVLPYAETGRGNEIYDYAKKLDLVAFIKVYNGLIKGFTPQKP